MRFLSLSLLVWLALSFPRTLDSQTSQLVPFSIPPSDAPQLAMRGSYPVGVRTVQIVHHAQVDILRFDKQTGKAPLYDRPLTLEIWYPAIIPKGQEERTTYISAMPGRDTSSPAGSPKTFEIAGAALRDAKPLAGSRFPLVIVSHGYPGSRTLLTYLTENIASKGYVVAAIDHTDSVFGAVKEFASTLLNRSADQLFTIQAIAVDPFFRELVDAQNVAVIGYSMGGYGALITAGAGLSQESALPKIVPGGYLDSWSNDSTQFRALNRSAVKAIVAIAPWGEQLPYHAWDAQGLAEIRIPSLFIAGDQDDVADYAHGIKPAFDGAINSPRYMLVYANARHNTGGNPPPPGIPLSYAFEQSFNEPVWRKDRITAINQHFVTAFLDLTLKKDESRRKYLELPLPSSSEGKWVLPEGVSDTGQFSSGKDADGNSFWTGFQKRWALGLQMLRGTPAQ